MDKMAEQSHPELSLPALKAGDRLEFSRLVETYSAPIYRLALKITGDPQDAEDVLQETFIKAYRHINEFEGRASLSTWLYRIASNEAFMLLRRRHPEAVSVDADVQSPDGEQGPVEIADWCCLPEEELLTAESRDYLDHAVDTLSPNLKVVFILRDIEGLSVRETAEALRISEAAVKTRLLRARLQLREQLSHYFAERLQEEKRI
jgi:RNA polymerase sigma-70 factor (ECF subfamily)